MNRDLSNAEVIRSGVPTWNPIDPGMNYQTPAPELIPGK